MSKPDLIGQLIDLGEKVPVRVRCSNREQRLEAALREIQERAACSQHPVMKIIATKCREALTTGEGE